ncbi:YybH family protein [Sandaracinus amylolyticus]|uniref:YybH family protein n=1 Tax=Sandaracinus amylolyticus TaxID=927083 RepID=UPI001F4690AD|nr:SgcJ/EcaC family oxidoreductase [Sandaracinus amylolyticus]UJR85115.1 Hypothetical protein I5071_71950 [Sandaracinus amylolyticus]
MTKRDDETAIRAVFETLSAAFRERDAVRIARQYAPDALIYDLAPPLGHVGMDTKSLEAWLATWQGPIEHTIRDLRISTDGDLALAHSLVHVGATTKQGERAEWWMRATAGLRRANGGWKIVHEHTSVPFHMDGSFRAATDLEP